MRSLERSRGKDLDQVNPEHVDRESAEFPWDNLKTVPFAGNNLNKSNTQKELSSALEELLPDIARRKNEEKLKELRAKMDELGSFGKNARTDKESYNKAVEDFKSSFDADET